MVPTCPLCAIPIAADRPCNGCGLWWSRSRRGSSADGHDAPARSVVCRAGDLCGRAIVAACLGGIGIGAIAATLLAASRDPGARTIAGAILCTLVGGVLIETSIAILGDGVLRAIFPERIDRDGERVRVRVRSRSGRRSDARVPRSMIRDVVLVPWRLGTQEVWVVVDGERMFRVAEAMMPPDAKRHASAVAAAIHGRAPLPRARIVRRERGIVSRSRP